MLVELLGRRDVGVAQDQLRIAGGHACVLQKRCGSVAQVMNRDTSQPRLIAQFVESLGEVSWPQR